MNDIKRTAYLNAMWKQAREYSNDPMRQTNHYIGALETLINELDAEIAMLKKHKKQKEAADEMVVCSTENVYD